MSAWDVEPRKQLPLYNVARGPAETTLVASPPFNFPGVTARVFPLRASLNLLTGFCESYLNVARHVCELQPYLPYVLLVVLDYGRMAIEEANLGWVSQREVFFSVPLGMWRRDRRGRRKFVKWVVNTPFIVVDSPTSLTTGRETYGWPKVLATLRYNPERWLIDPRNPLRLLTLDVRGLSCEHPDVPLLEIDQQLEQNISLLPPDFRLLEPFERLSRITRTSWAIGFDLADLLMASPLAGFGGQTPADRREVFLDSLRQLSGFYRQPGLDVVTLKQFRDAGDPTQICYQALVESRLSVARYNRGGLLGLYNQLQGDITGGFRIRLHENPALPIVESLGLEVAQERSSHGKAVSILEPFFPFWMSVDLTYGRGRTICWRMRGEPWYRKTVPVSARPKPKARAPYNTYAGGASQVWHGPFVVPNGTYDVFPLRADRQRLERFLSDYLSLNRNQDGGVSPGHPRNIPQLSFEVVGEHVYMVASRNRMFSAARSAAWIEACQIAFYVPIHLHHENGQELLMATPFAFVDNPTLAMTLREVQGVPAMDATVEAPSRFWDDDGPLLRMDVDVFTALDAGLGSERRTLLEVMCGGPAQSESGAQPTVPSGGLPAGGPVSMGRLMLKQFRDAAEPDRACYQSLVFEPWTFSGLGPVTRLDRVKEVRVYRYPSLPLAETLCLRCASMEPPRESEGAIADILVPENPFRVQFTAEIGLGKVLSHMAGTLPWQPPRLSEMVRPAGQKIQETLASYDLAGAGLEPVIQAFLGLETDDAAGGGA